MTHFPHLNAALLALRWFACAACVCGAGLVHAQAPSSPSLLLVRRGGSSEPAVLREIDAAGTLQFLTGAKGFSLAPGEIWCFGGDRAVLRGPYLLLRDHSRIAAPQVTTDGKEFVLRADEFHPGIGDGWRVARREVRALVWKLSHGEAALAEVLALEAPVQADTLKLDNGDLVQGEFRGMEAGEGDSAGVILFEVRGRASRIPLERMVSLQLAESQPPAASAASLEGAWTLAFADGSRHRAVSLVAQAKGVSWKTPGGVAREVDSALFWKELAFVEPPPAGAIYLSELSPQGYRHFPMFGEPAIWGKDRSAAGRPLRYRDAYMERGIGVWSNSRISFVAPPGVKRLEARVCLDDAAGKQGSVVFRVLTQNAPKADGKPAALKDRFRSEVVRGGDAAQEVSVAVEGGDTVILLVEAADRGDAMDFADWLEARFVP